MDKYARLKRECELLKTRLEELKNTPVDENHESIKQIQIAFLRKALTRLGHQLRNHAISKGVYDD